MRRLRRMSDSMWITICTVLIVATLFLADRESRIYTGGVFIVVCVIAAILAVAEIVTAKEHDSE